jgi:UDP-glucuronate decarboxylase
LIEGMMRMMSSEKCFTGPVNLGNPAEYTVLELAETVLRLSGSSSKLTFWPRPPDDPRHRQPDISMASRELVWEPRVTLEDGLKETITYFRLLLNLG